MTSREIMRARWIVQIAARMAACVLLTWAAAGFVTGWSGYSRARAQMAMGMVPRQNVFEFFKDEWARVLVGVSLPLTAALLGRRIVPPLKHACATCGYDLKGLARCPECNAEA